MKGKYCQCKDNFLSGSALTKYTCIECKKVFNHNKINTPKLCIDCARKLQLCNKCALPINLLD